MSEIGGRMRARCPECNVEVVELHDVDGDDGVLSGWCNECEGIVVCEWGEDIEITFIKGDRDE